MTFSCVHGPMCGRRWRRAEHFCAELIAAEVQAGTADQLSTVLGELKGGATKGRPVDVGDGGSAA